MTPPSHTALRNFHLQIQPAAVPQSIGHKSLQIYTQYVFTVCDDLHWTNGLSSPLSTGYKVNIYLTLLRMVLRWQRRWTAPPHPPCTLKMNRMIQSVMMSEEPPAIITYFHCTVVIISLQYMPSSSVEQVVSNHISAYNSPI